MKIDMNQFLESFFDESSEHIEIMEGALLEFESNPKNVELLNTIFRSAHTIKGASSTFGVQAVADFTHVMENLLDRMRDGKIIANPEITEVLLVSVDTLRNLLEAARNGNAGPDNVDEVLAQLKKHNTLDSEPDAEGDMEGSQAENDSECIAQTYQVSFKPSREFFHYGLEPILLLRDLAELGSVEDVTLDVSQLPDLESMDPETCYLAWTVQIETDASIDDIRDVFMFVDDATVIEIEPIQQELRSADDPTSTEPSEETTPSEEPTETASAESKPPQPVTTATPQRESVRVDGERLDHMINQIGELVIGISMVEEEWAANHPGTESPAVTQLSKIVRELQERSLSLRMVPIGGCFQKMARVVRDLSRKLDKKIDFVTSGEETELDKTVVDKIGDPLLHMIRNAVDHGIESQEERVAAGKPVEGKVTLKAFHKGGNIYVEITDDGKGLNLQRIKSKAIERGVLSADENPTDQELANLIFAPGFSTAEQVTDVSGRGVGMDVVRRNVESLQGSVSVRTEEGKGSTVTVRLPLTLAILDGLTVRLGNEVLVLPLLAVVESIHPKASDIKTVMNKGEVISLRGDVVPLIRLHEHLNMQTSVTEASDGLLVIVEDQNRKYALLVDELLGQQQVVIKNLETNFTKVAGVAGATILGNGRVAFILDINGICSPKKNLGGAAKETPESALV